jgi:uncharacterized protein
VRIGLLSDTHGLLRPEVFRALEGVDHVLHAGDVGPPELLDELEAIAPVTAVFGNTDGWALRARTVESARVSLGGVRAAVLHGHLLPAATAAHAAAANPGAGLIVYGHSHRPEIRRIGDALVVNPGSAGPRRFRDPVTLAVARIEDGAVSAELIRLVE